MKCRSRANRPEISFVYPCFRRCTTLSIVYACCSCSPLGASAPIGPSSAARMATAMSRGGGAGTTGTAAHLERNRKRPLEDADSASRLVDARRHGRPNLAHHRHRRRPRLLRHLRRRRDGQSPAQQKAVPLRRARAARQHLNCYAAPSPAIEPGRVYVHFGSYGTACLDTATGEVAVAARRPALPPLPRPVIVRRAVRKPRDPHARRRRPAVRRGARQGDRRDRLEDGPRRRVERPGRHRPAEVPSGSATATIARPTARRS